MGNPQKIKFKNVSDFFENISAEELAIVEIIRELVLENVPDVKEKLAYNGPFYYRQMRICYIWPASTPWGGLSERVFA
jgi:Mn-containing catalase